MFFIKRYGNRGRPCSTVVKLGVFRFSGTGLWVQILVADLHQLSAILFQQPTYKVEED